MHQKDSLTERAVSDFRAARQRFELYEKFYLSLSDRARQYLKRESIRYKTSLREIQTLILPYVRETCPTCDRHCCRLIAPELSVYTACTVGGFGIADYLMIRYDEILPDPFYENTEMNLCPFWDEGCILPVDCRSFLCIQFFCDRLEKTIDMKAVKEPLRKIQAVLDAFSIAECML
jgi:hypothetical protein